MSIMAKTEEYAELIVKIGMNVQPGQTVFITAPINCAGLVRACVSECYKAGCREVVTHWSDDEVTRMKYLHAEDSVFDIFPEWSAMLYNDMADMKAARLSITGNDPESLKGALPSRIQRFQRQRGEKLKEYYNAMVTNVFQWCVAACPTEAWAKKVFPECKDAGEAVELLWEAIFQTVRVNGDGGAVKRWEEHVALCKTRVEKLNGFAFKALKYKNSLGTDLTAELVENHFWEGGSERASNGAEFIANLPTEEVFTAPRRDGVNGDIAASKPLVLNGNIVEGIRFTLKDGKIVEAASATNEQYLKETLAVDEGASYLGEIALVPYDSPISNSGLLFFNTLFDENASCHFAFGEAYPSAVGADKLSADERLAIGLNKSYVHEDFMVGTPDLSIIGITKDGAEVPVFIDGNFAF